MAAIPAIGGEAGLETGLRPGRREGPGFGSGWASAFNVKWTALHDAAAIVGRIAGVESRPPPVRNIAVALRGASGRRRELAEQGLEDLVAVMEPGLAALLATLARGADPRPAAAALWREFVTARDQLLALA